MTESESKYLQLNRINKGIEELREVLNEICITIEGNEKYEKRLAISKCLDELILDYMKELQRLNRIDEKD